MDLTLNCFLLGCFENYTTRLVELPQTLKCQKNFKFINLFLSFCHLCLGTDFLNCLPVLWTRTDARQFIFKFFKFKPILAENFFFFQKQVGLFLTPSISNLAHPQQLDQLNKVCINSCPVVYLKIRIWYWCPWKAPNSNNYFTPKWFTFNPSKYGFRELCGGLICKFRLKVQTSTLKWTF